MATAWLSLGANIGDAAAQIEAAIATLGTIPDLAVTARSPLLRTPAWGRTDQPDFLNAAVAVETTLPPIALLDACQDIERDLGRVRREYWGPRRIDIDLIAYEHVVLRSIRLTLPHPWAAQRDFVLTPLRQIAPEITDWLMAMGDIGT